MADPRNLPPADDELREEDVTLADALDDRVPDGEQLSELERRRGEVSQDAE